MLNYKLSTPNLSHHFLQGRRSRALAQALPALNKRFKSFSQTNNYSTLFFTAGKTWPSGPERTARKYGWNSSGRKQQGFTIIEVVLVLAIAGLIFLIVFIALPALQRSQRDSQRKNHARSLVDAANRRMSNSRGDITLGVGYTGWSMAPLIASGYLKEDEMRDPSTNEVYTMSSAALGGYLYAGYQDIQAGEYGGDIGGYCRGNVPVDISGSANGRSVVYVFGLESGGWVCASNVMK